ncbi:hypothetical protein GOP47_0031001 [Adiantum capillus-veneris]|nr:hypothetical protein GOP47_0031001 [Adiantum capillus-veneris]
MHLSFAAALVQAAILLFAALAAAQARDPPGMLLSPGLAALKSPLSADQVANYTQQLASSGRFTNTDEFCGQAHIQCGATASSLAFNSCTRMSRRRRLLDDTILQCRNKHAAEAVTTLELFFTRFSDMQPGNTITVSEPELLGSRLSTSRSFLPKPISDLLPMSVNKLPSVLSTLDIAPTSDMATAIATNLQMCTDKDPKGFNDRTCSFSLEDLTSFVTSRVGTSTPKAMEFFYDATIVDQPLTILSLDLVSPAGTKQYSCHTMSFAFTAQYCHNLPSTNIYKMSANVTDKTSGKTTTYDNLGVSCHLDTSGFSPNHPAMRKLNRKPGEGEVCHLLVNAVVYAAPS